VSGRQLLGIERKAENGARHGNYSIHKRLLTMSIRPGVNRQRPGRLAEDCDQLGITSKKFHVVMQPFYGHALVAKAQVLGLSWSAWEAEDADAIIDRDHDHVFGLGKVAPIVEWSVRVSVGESLLRVSVHSSNAKSEAENHLLPP
jgi:hypothetical protein